MNSRTISNFVQRFINPFLSGTGEKLTDALQVSRRKWFLYYAELLEISTESPNYRELPQREVRRSHKSGFWSKGTDEAGGQSSKEADPGEPDLFWGLSGWLRPRLLKRSLAQFLSSYNIANMALSPLSTTYSTNLVDSPFQLHSSIQRPCSLY